MKKIVIILLIIVIAIGAAIGIVLHNKGADDQAIEGNYEKYKYGSHTFYEPDYPNGNSANNIKSLTYTVPDTYTPVQSNDDSLAENVYINLSNGSRIALSAITNKDAEELATLDSEYLEGVSNIVEIQIGNIKGYRYDYMENDQVIQSGFHFISDGTLYAGTQFVLSESEEDITDDYEATPISESMTEDFNAVCDSLSLAN